MDCVSPIPLRSSPVLQSRSQSAAELSSLLRTRPVFFASFVNTSNIRLSRGQCLRCMQTDERLWSMSRNEKRGPRLDLDQHYTGPGAISDRFQCTDEGPCFESGGLAPRPPAERANRAASLCSIRLLPPVIETRISVGPQDLSPTMQLQIRVCDMAGTCIVSRADIHVLHTLAA